MNEIIKIIENACLKHHDSGETSITREARLIVEALAEAGYEIKRSRYTKKLDPEFDDDIHTVDEWKEIVEKGYYGNLDENGSGYWVKDGMISDDEVCSTPQLDATHVVWYNK